jgi:hypothetical protein
LDGADNCPSVANADQANRNGEIIALPSPIVFNDGTNAHATSLGDACNPDVDGDGLTAAQEAVLGTDAAKADTDGDRHIDGAEVTCGGDPLNPAIKVSGADADHDSVPDACEAIIGTTASNPDTDGDGVSDGVEFLKLGTDPLVRDSDGDGCDDGHELASVNGDHTVNSIDLAVVAQHFGNQATYPDYFWDFDMTRDGATNSLDLAIVASVFGPCQP